jgi:hypothetical protein
MIFSIRYSKLSPGRVHPQFPEVPEVRHERKLSLASSTGRCYGIFLSCSAIAVPEAMLGSVTSCLKK